MKGYRKHQRVRQNKSCQTKKDNNYLNFYILTLLLPILMHLSLFSKSGRYVWIMIFILLGIFIKWKKYQALECGIAALIIYAGIIIPFLLKKTLPDETYTIEGSIVKTGSNYYIIQNNRHNILVFKNRRQNFELYSGGSISVEGYLSSNLDSLKMNSSFLQSNSIKYVLQKPTVNWITVPDRSLKKYIESYGYGKEYFRKYWKMVLFGLSGDSFEEFNNINKLNVLHLLVVSGLHFDLLFKFLNFIFKPITKRFKPFRFIIFFFMFWYVTLLRAFISGLRSLIMNITKNEKRIGWYKFKTLDGFFISLIIIFIINRDLIFSLSLVFSFCCSFLIIVLNALIPGDGLLKSFTVFLCVYSFNVPLTLFLNQHFNFFGFIWGIVLTPVFEIIYITSIFSFWSIDFLDSFYFAVDKIFRLCVDVSPILEHNLKISEIIISLNIFTWLVFIAFLKILKNKISRKRLIR